mmetsp:Transcript_36435/g.88675  ORF Transcript_36435/g.88675 Transcript_36435/m.88675 type:complete len:203 (+) Transcript_36435:339-947(+)
MSPAMSAWLVTSRCRGGYHDRNKSSSRKLSIEPSGTSAEARVPSVPHSSWLLAPRRASSDCADSSSGEWLTPSEPFVARRASDGPASDWGRVNSGEPTGGHGSSDSSETGERGGQSFTRSVSSSSRAEPLVSSRASNGPAGNWGTVLSGKSSIKGNDLSASFPDSSGWEGGGQLFTRSVSSSFRAEPLLRGNSLDVHAGLCS